MSPTLLTKGVAPAFFHTCTQRGPLPAESSDVDVHIGAGCPERYCTCLQPLSTKDVQIRMRNVASLAVAA